METLAAYRVLIHILVEEFGRQASDIKASASFRGDLAFDSLELFELVNELEEAFGCEIPDDDLAKIRTVEQAVNYALSHPCPVKQ